VSNLSNRFTSAINNLKSKDDRKRRRAVRELFEIDDEENLSAFIPLLDDKDSWYRSKAIDAFRIWSIRKNVSDLQPLITHHNLNYNRVAANLLENFRAENIDIVKKLFSKNDLICQKRAAEFILKAENEREFFDQLIANEDEKLRIVALNSKYSDKENLIQAIDDKSLKVAEYSISKLIDSDYSIDDNVLDELIERGAEIKLLISYLVRNNPKKLIQNISKINNTETKVLVDVLQKECPTIDHEIIKMLNENQQHVIVGRWLQGKKGDTEDKLRWEIIGNDDVDEIERCRLIERLFSRCQEEPIRLKAKQISESSTSDLIKITAHNLSTANNGVQS
tara:strand:- start:131 stop:1138 length:1008 start_codon:yes stop_codon:yes gene_type:complete